MSRIAIPLAIIVAILSGVDVHNWRRVEISGVDISHHNQEPEWGKVKVDFIFLKATEGESYADPVFSSRLDSCHKYDIPVGAYHFLTTASSAEAQFKNFRNCVGRPDIDLLPVLDSERMSKGHVMTPEKYAEHVRTWVDLCLKHYGKTPIIYSSVGFYEKNLKGHVDDCLFWCGDIKSPREYVDRCEWVIWQSDIREVNGFKGKVDYDKLHSGATVDDIMLRPKGQKPTLVTPKRK